MALKLINGTKPPDTIKERVRASLRTTKQADMLQCPVCGGRSHIELRTGTLRQRICKFCDWDKRIVLME